MVRDMEKEKNMIIFMVKLNLKGNIKMERDMEKEKNMIIIMVKLNLKGNI